MSICPPLLQNTSAKDWDWDDIELIFLKRKNFISLEIHSFLQAEASLILFKIFLNFFTTFWKFGVHFFSTNIFQVRKTTFPTYFYLFLLTAQLKDYPYRSILWAFGNLAMGFPVVLVVMGVMVTGDEIFATDCTLHPVHNAWTAPSRPGSARTTIFYRRTPLVVFTLPSQWYE